MPRYDYECIDCDHVFEVKQSFDDESISSCPDYGKGKTGSSSSTSEPTKPKDAPSKSDNGTKTDGKPKESSSAKSDSTPKVAGDN